MTHSSPEVLVEETLVHSLLEVLASTSLSISGGRGCRPWEGKLSDFISNIVHPSTYNAPTEWGYLPELDPEQVHEALMHLLLKEIAHIDEEKADVQLATVGCLLVRDLKLELE
ncbi:hypothetical protein FRC12_003250 [Ceratobasidium sp. 428]|nr:hypothetical protein FRC12_003250 [Ceratobasidium sp. 428]